MKIKKGQSHRHRRRRQRQDRLVPKSLREIESRRREGVNTHKKHRKPTKQSRRQIVEIYAPIDATTSRCRSQNDKGTRVAIKVVKDQKVRVQGER
jgi:hypothetical protein